LGTLDPIATGVLPVALGRATRLIRFLESDDKVYQGTVRLGEATDTQDATGKTLFNGEWRGLDPAAITAAVSTFLGETSQVPPMHSAVKKDGKPLYKLARRGIEVERKPRKVRVFAAFVEKISMPDVVVRIRCAPGTYMRTIAHDLGMRLGCGAHLLSLARLWSGPFGMDQAMDLDGLDPETAARLLIPMSECLPHFPAIEITQSQVAMMRDGMSIKASDVKGPARPRQRHRILRDGELVAVALGVEHGEQILLRPLRVFT
jgi:tRNA pseudouridine55 synthase